MQSGNVGDERADRTMASPASLLMAKVANNDIFREMSSYMTKQTLQETGFERIGN